MPDTRRLEKIEQKTQARAPRSDSGHPGGYYGLYQEMTTEQLEAEQARLRAASALELQKLNGALPPYGIEEDHPGYIFHSCETLSWLLDTVLCPRLDKALVAASNRYYASKEPEEQKRLLAEYWAVVGKIRAVEARCKERNEVLQIRQRVKRPEEVERCQSTGRI